MMNQRLHKKNYKQNITERNTS